MQTNKGSFGRQSWCIGCCRYVDKQHITVIELQQNTGDDDLVGFMSFGPSVFSRSSTCRLNDANLILFDRFRRRNWAAQLLHYNAMMSRDAGYIATQGTTSLDTAVLAGACHIDDVSEEMQSFFSVKHTIHNVMHYSLKLHCGA